jgi:hypothetical protein
VITAGSADIEHSTDDSEEQLNEPAITSIIEPDDLEIVPGSVYLPPSAMVPNVFCSPYQDAPLDFDSPDFYESR